MKRLFTLLTILVLAVLGLSLLPSEAEAASESDLTFELNSDGESYYVSKCSESASGALVIPAAFNGKSVTSIGENAFYNCTTLTSVTIPDSVASIGKGAFKDCSRLTSVTIPDSVTSIGESAFSSCYSLSRVNITDIVAWCKIDFSDYVSNPLYMAGNLYLNGALLTNLVIPDSITSIGMDAFRGCTSITGITFHNSVTTIGDFAFCECTSLTSITIPESITSIGGYAFYDCESLICVEIAGPVKIIPEFAFCGCSNLKNIILPKGIDTIGTWAFTHCYSLKNVFHRGSQEDWDWIVIKNNNELLRNVTITHSFTGNHIRDGVVTKAATCKEEGIKTYTCPDCKATKTEKIAKVNTHTYDHACDVSCNVCGATRTTTHNYKTTWSKDKTNHWHECSVCKDKKDVVAHTPGAEATETSAQKCTVCGYVIKAALGHTHNYASDWTTDENGHWHACSGCEEKGNYAPHTPGPAATATTDQTCTICGYVLKEATGGTEPAPQPTEPSGTEATQPESTPATPTEPTTTPVVPSEPVGNSEPSADSTVWIIVAVAVAVLGGGAGAGIIIWKKKR